jgi:hypothetical protein
MFQLVIPLTYIAKHEPLLRQTSCNIGQWYNQLKHEPLFKPHIILIKNYDYSSNKPLKHRNDRLYH